MNVMVDPVYTRDELEDGRGASAPGVRSSYAEILDEAHVMIRDTNDRIVFWNSGEERLYGWTRDEALRQVSHQLLQTKFPQPLTAIQAALERDGQWKGELLHCTRDGTQITVASHWVLHRDDQGQPRAVLEVNNDITELKRSEQTIQHLNLAFANAMPGLFKVDAMGRFVEVNDHFAQMHGYKSSKLLASDWRLTIHPEDQATALQAYEHLLDNGNAELEVRAIRKDGSVFVEHMLLVAVNDGRGMSAGHYGFTRDTTHRKREDQLRESRERLRAFAIHLDSAIESERIRISRQIHDELGQALTSLAIDLAWLDDHVTDAVQEPTVTAVQEKIGSMANVLDGMIADVRRIAGELRPPLLEKVGLAAAVETHARRFQERAGIRCNTTFSGEIEMEQERAVNVFRIYQEAMTNVARHTGANYVNIRLAQRDDCLVLEVQSDGRAITEAAAKNPKTQGILGMKERARILGGSLSVCGIAGTGTLVRLEVPNIHLSPARLNGSDKRSSDITILLVDDHPIFRQGVKQIFRESSLKVAFYEAQDAASMNGYICARGFDLVLLDLSLPDKSGLECLRELKRIRPLLPVLVLSMYRESQFALPALKAGATGYLAKERAPKELLAVVKKILEGDKYISQELSKQITIELLDGTGKLPHECLSRREFQILLRIASGEALTAIAKESSLSPKTVSTYRSRILEKMGLKTNADLTRYCTRHMLIP